MVFEGGSLFVLIAIPTDESASMGSLSKHVNVRSVQPHRVQGTQSEHLQEVMDGLTPPQG